MGPVEAGEVAPERGEVAPKWGEVIPKGRDRIIYGSEGSPSLAWWCCEEYGERFWDVIFEESFAYSFDRRRTDAIAVRVWSVWCAIARGLCEVVYKWEIGDNGGSTEYPEENC